MIDISSTKTTGHTVGWIMDPAASHASSHDGETAHPATAGGREASMGSDKEIDRRQARVLMSATGRVGSGKSSKFSLV